MISKKTENRLKEIGFIRLYLNEWMDYSSAIPIPLTLKQRTTDAFIKDEENLTIEWNFVQKRWLLHVIRPLQKDCYYCDLHMTRKKISQMIKLYEFLKFSNFVYPKVWERLQSQGYPFYSSIIKSITDGKDM